MLLRLVPSIPIYICVDTQTSNSPSLFHYLLLPDLAYAVRIRSWV